MLKALVRSCAIEDKPRVLAVEESQLFAPDEMLCDLACLLKNGYQPDLFNKNELHNLAVDLKGQMSMHDLNKSVSHQISQPILAEIIRSVISNFKVMLSISPNGILINKELW